MAHVRQVQDRRGESFELWMDSRQREIGVAQGGGVSIWRLSRWLRRNGRGQSTYLRLSDRLNMRSSGCRGHWFKKRLRRGTSKTAIVSWGLPFLEWRDL